MKVKENLYEKRGRPRKFKAGDITEWNIRAPENLLMELRIFARTRQRSMNDEIMQRLMESLNYRPDMPLIKTVEGQQLQALSRKFYEWITETHPEIPQKPDAESTADESTHAWIDERRVLLPGKTQQYSMRIPENLATELRLMAQINQRSINDEILTRLMHSLHYFTETWVGRDKDITALKVLALSFDKFIREQTESVEEAALPWNKKEK